MLGIKTRRAPIGGDIADQIRDAVARVATGQLNERERAQVERSKRLSEQYEAHWFGLDGKEIQHPY
ncbi:MAG: capsular biosynthesis protein [Bacteroidaceae bacterium]|nr:capsular biosynthesis protein [Bacteroidaceae bacterium]